LKDFSKKKKKYKEYIVGKIREEEKEKDKIWKEK